VHANQPPFGSAAAAVYRAARSFHLQLHPSPQKIFALRMRIALFKTLQIVDDTRYYEVWHAAR
jgi:hypothetical protein